MPRFLIFDQDSVPGVSRAMISTVMYRGRGMAQNLFGHCEELEELVKLIPKMK